MTFAAHYLQPLIVRSQAGACDMENRSFVEQKGRMRCLLDGETCGASSTTERNKKTCGEYVILGYFCELHYANFLNGALS